MVIKVIGAGFGRTGTGSLRNALEKLGYDKCYHMSEIMKNPVRANDWYNASLKKMLIGIMYLMVINRQ